ncbi:hypothetical protein C5E07_09675 [Pseudoclavibacter sp. RFBJ3]|uniref:DUF1622 domain-containing protein n=1 Tax=unclassified Pseudoclavibacter TaxID=2615177 RepID=UPI000CE821F3|nr:MULTISPECIES: DUF1622 domain-containing protein [unclassified Pseudoclavibacter]PPF76332.1 hypothetical protein C5B99_10945 [Pseudoclavibacter sp. Z016]PPF83756.1 hypothetical protein C5C12_08755 [Pseudoclavibacter sp. RFBJ5]PPF92036.1 hypothetical protein C5E07_09675 [Pseudoclavibacter sp. RFBJ3]PPF96899.1 hypothetical protein C5C19_12985 [Pseudoclavibacter sp. RFBH5]PPG23585.1 hypothetical protein C5E13_08370 [Pseudoclavibacter sp. RFBI4]
MQQSMDQVFEIVAVVVEALGASAIVIGIVIAVVLAVLALVRGKGGKVALATLRTSLGAGILLGLEVLVAADLVRTITSKPSLEDALILGLIVVIRTVLSMSIQIEIEGVLPWRRALTTSGAQLLADQVRAAGRPESAGATGAGEGRTVV